MPGAPGVTLPDGITSIEEVPADPDEPTLGDKRVPEDYIFDYDYEVTIDQEGDEIVTRGAPAFLNILEASVPAWTRHARWWQGTSCDCTPARVRVACDLCGCRRHCESHPLRPPAERERCGGVL